MMDSTFFRAMRIISWRPCSRPMLSDLSAFRHFCKTGCGMCTAILERMNLFHMTGKMGFCISLLWPRIHVTRLAWCNNETCQMMTQCAYVPINKILPFANHQASCPLHTSKHTGWLRDTRINIGDIHIVLHHDE